ncbi:hypothetical protein B0H17DRAFT_4218 [Mycena rosella]|uniref:Uncharacterized protein n=1 Tax=Mycena rosella TaxID=1033263 RepID=A0AAD7H2Y5_MYCRO|nr:hypothetical protein B0H17DRAFT_4218 [Mycena rosella]
MFTAQSPAHMFQNATRFGIEGSQFIEVLGNMNINHLAPPSAVREQSIGPAAGNALDIPRDVYTDSGSYCSQLLCRGRGFPLYVPGPQRNLPREYQRDGVTIGDVGRVTPEGIFDFFFNIYLDADDPINVDNVPEGFYPLKRYVSRDVVYLDFEPGNHVSTHSVQKRDLEPSSGDLPGLDFMFDCSAPQGAVLALPHRSHLEKLENMAHMRRYAAKNAESWYKYINGERGRGLSNGALYLVTGLEKSQSWGMAAFQEVTIQTEFQLSFKPTVADRCRWIASGPATTKASGPIPIHDEPLNQTLFIHGLSISLGNGIWGRLFKGVEICQLTESQLGRPNNQFLPYASQGFLSSWSWGFLGGGGTQGGKQCAGRSEDPNGVDVSQFPPASPIFHPSQVINIYLLAKFPSATVVMSHDDDWRDILQRYDEPPAVRNSFNLLQQICDQYVAIEEDGAVFLAKKYPEGLATIRNTITQEAASSPASSIVSAALLPAEHSSQLSPSAETGSSDVPPGNITVSMSPTPNLNWDHHYSPSLPAEASPSPSS